MGDVLVVIVSLSLIGLIVWWFFGKRPDSQAEATATNSGQSVEVVVDGGYTPNTVVLKQGVPAQIIFNRQDPSNCFNEVMFPDFGVHQELPVNQRFAIDIDTSKTGEYSYACGMNMFHGKVVIK